MLHMLNIIFLGFLKNILTSSTVQHGLDGFHSLASMASIISFPQNWFFVKVLIYRFFWSLNPFLKFFLMYLDFEDLHFDLPDQNDLSYQILTKRTNMEFLLLNTRFLGVLKRI